MYANDVLGFVQVGIFLHWRRFLQWYAWFQL